jgi:DNA-directed RNA polymerase I subunit RPA2
MNSNTIISSSNIKPNIKKNERLLKKVTGKVEDLETVRKIALHHIDSFDYAMGVVLKKLPRHIYTMEIKSTEKTQKIFKSLKICYEDFELGMPVLDSSISFKKSNILYPSECRERELTYSAPLIATIKRKFDSDAPESFKVKLGNIPVMVKSKFCNLSQMNINELVEKKEDVGDFGGYFIVNGLEKLIRMLAIPRRNYPIGLMYVYIF